MTIGQVKEADCFDRLYPGRFLKAGLLMDKAVTLTIDKVFIETMPDEKNGGERDRGIVAFKETPMQLALNRTNGECLKAMFGKKPKQWTGKKVTFVPEMAKFGKDDVDAIRIKGSPDITQSITIEIKMPKRKPQVRTLVPTGKTQNQPAVPKVDSVPPPQDTPQVNEENNEGNAQ